jgi:DNA-binding NtrC family response regulator
MGTMAGVAVLPRLPLMGLMGPAAGPAVSEMRRCVMEWRMRVVIVDPHRAMRTALRALLDAEPDVEVAGDGPDLSALADAERAGAVDVGLVDGRTAGMSSSEARSALERLSRRAAVVVMGMGELAL